ncbi:MAG: hypothetical protein HY794_06715 [Desulfarculus sp.]|nr:hypothetical protein [Desulfarculus sp.]
MALLLGLPGGAAAKPGSGTHGKSNTGEVYLYAMDPLAWTVTPGGAWAKMSYHLDEVAYQGQAAGQITSFEFNGHGLTAGVEYTLLYGNDLATPAVPSQVQMLSQGVVNNGGNLHLDAGPATSTLHDAQLWLVLSADWSQGAWNKWQPSQYLFSQGLLFETTAAPSSAVK